MQRVALSGYESLLPSAPARALVAAEDEILRQQIAMALREDGYEVVEAQDGFEALDAILAPPWRRGARGVELVVADADMVGYDGLEVLSRLRAIGKATPFILINRNRHPAIWREAERLGADLVIEDPWEIDQVRNAVFSLAPVA